MSSAFCSKSYRCKNENWCAKDYNPEPYDYECFEPMTNADKLRQMSDDELADFIAMQRFSVVNPIADTLGIDVTTAFIAGRKNALNWLKQEVADEAD